MLVSATITVVGTSADAAAITADRNNKQAIFENCAPFPDCINGMINTQVDNIKDLDVVMPMYNLIEYSDNYLKHLEFHIKFIETKQMIMIWQILNRSNLNQNS